MSLASPAPRARGGFACSQIHALRARPEDRASYLRPRVTSAVSAIDGDVREPPTSSRRESVRAPRETTKKASSALAASLLASLCAVTQLCRPAPASARRAPAPAPAPVSFALPVPPSADLLGGAEFDFSAGEISRHNAPRPRRKKMNSFVREAAERVGPCVVRVDVADDVDHPSRVGGRGSAPPLKPRGQGCGLVISSSAASGSGGSRSCLVVTNAHVLDGALSQGGAGGRVRVTFVDGRGYDAVVVGADSLADVALLRIPLAPDHALPPPPKLGDSETLETGDWVIALGNPFGLDNTITLGIASNLARSSAELGIPERRVNFLQTDCAINPGNSGGPLVNEFGEVIAINTAIRADAEGIGFAIPINDVRRVVKLLAEGKRVAHPYLGVQMVTRESKAADASDSGRRAGEGEGSFLANARGAKGDFDGNSGALVVKVFPGSPAAAAGVRVGDVCVAVGGRTLRDAVQVQREVAATAPGAPLTLTVERDGKARDFTLTAIDRATSPESFLSPRARTREGDRGEEEAVSENRWTRCDNETEAGKKERRRGDADTKRFASPPGVGLRPQSYGEGPRASTNVQ